MALIKLGGLAQDVRGSLNGTTFSRNRGGAYVRTKVSPVQPVSDYSSRSRAIFKDLSQRWATTLTAGQRAAWIAWAAVHPIINVFGDSIIMSGIAAYQAINRRLGEIGATYLDDPPSTFTIATPVLDEMTVHNNSSPGALDDVDITLVTAYTPPQGLYVFWQSMPAPGRTPQKSGYRLINSPATGVIADATDFSAAILARFPLEVFTTNERIEVLIAGIDPTTGACSVGVAASQIVTTGP